jgi:hypothetical protein
MTGTGPEPESPEDSEGPVDAEGLEDSESPGDSEGAQDEARRKFREALDRKQGSNGGAAGRIAGNDTGKVHGAHGPASSRRSFRRRGGG